MLAPTNVSEILLIMAVALFMLGATTTITGVIILLTRAASRDLHNLAIQTSKLAQKGIAEDVAGLVGNASALLEAVNQMVRTASGIGIFLTIFGLIMMIAACWLGLQVL